jgi:hypothetical protein
MSDYLHYGSSGPRVKALQRQLNVNAYRHPRRLLDVDGEFGPLTAAAVQDVKWWCGYPKEELKPIAGDELIGYLSGDETLPGDYRDRRKLRIERRDAERAQQTDADKMRLRALGIIRAELGTLEKPLNSNHIKYNDWWGWGPVPYCAIFISWAWVHAGSKAFIRGVRWAGCREMLAAARDGDYGLHLTHEPDPGCPGVVDLDGDASPDHAITFVRDNGDGTCQTIEANTSKDSTYIQGVFNKTRRMSDIWWFSVEK